MSYEEAFRIVLDVARQAACVQPADAKDDRQLSKLKGAIGIVDQFFEQHLFDVGEARNLSQQIDDLDALVSGFDKYGYND